VKQQFEFAGSDAQELYDIAPCGYMSTTPDGNIVAVNHTFLDWSGFLRDDLVSARNIQDLLTAPGRIFYETQFAPLLQLQGMVKAVAFDVVRKDASLLPVLMNATKRNSASFGGPLIHCAIFDATDRREYERELLRHRKELEEKVGHRTGALEREISDRQRAEESLRELTARLLQIKDEEQRRLARALHDSVGQLLAGLAMNQAAIAREKERLSDRSRAALAENIEITDQISSEIRTMSQLLHPPLLDEVGLRSALGWYIEGINKRGKMAIRLEAADDFGRLSGEMETAVFRIIQECLTNVHRHANCGRATVSLTRTTDEIFIVISDEGSGMPKERIEEIKLGRTSGVGLRGMRERVRQLNGALEIASGPTGTVVQVRLAIS